MVSVTAWCAGYVHLYGRDAQLHLVKRIADFEQRHARLLARLPEGVRHKFRRRHAAASEVPGSGSWRFPQPILDEAQYRRDCAAM
jgi:hypothetical protein